MRMVWLRHRADGHVDVAGAGARSPLRLALEAAATTIAAAAAAAAAPEYQRVAARMAVAQHLLQLVVALMERLLQRVALMAVMAPPLHRRRKQAVILGQIYSMQIHRHHHRHQHQLQRVQDGNCNKALSHGGPSTSGIGLIQIVHKMSNMAAMR